MNYENCPNCNSDRYETISNGGDDYTDIFECGSKRMRSNQTLLDQTDECEYKEAIMEAWRIINVFNMTAMDEGEAYDRATIWLHEWEHLCPPNYPPILTESELNKQLI